MEVNKSFSTLRQLELAVSWTHTRTSLRSSCLSVTELVFTYAGPSDRWLLHKLSETWETFKQGALPGEPPIHTRSRGSQHAHMDIRFQMEEGGAKVERGTGGGGEGGS